MKNNDYCGSCCFFKHEDTDGWEICYEDKDTSIYGSNPLKKE